MTRILFLLTILVSLAWSQTEIKFATLAPEGSTWMKVMEEFSADLEKSTNGQVTFKIYAGGVQGDEIDVLRKIRINQLHSAGFTGVALGEILPEVRVMDTPFLFRNTDEIDFIKKKFYQRFAAGFEKKGYILLGFAEVGWVYIYTNKAVRKLADMKGVKMWMWEGDPLSRETFNTFGVNAVPLSITDVSTSLQTGLIDGVYVSPLGCVALQWFTRVSHFLDVPLANSIGAVVISKRQFGKLSTANQKILLDKGREYFNKLTRLSREDNQKAKQQMLDYGLIATEPVDVDALNNFRRLGNETRQELAGKLYSRDLLVEVETALETYRAEQSSNGK